MKTAKDLMKEYGIDNIKAEIKTTPVHMLVECIAALEPKGHLIAGRNADDQQLRAIAIERSLITESLQCLSDTGRFKGELPADLTAPDAYKNLFAWLLALKGEIEKRCPDSEMFRSQYAGDPLNDWHELLASYHSDLPELLTALASRESSSDFSRANCMNPCYYAGWQDAGCDAMDVLFTSNEQAATESLLSKLDALANPYPQQTQIKGALAVLRHCVLSKAAAGELVEGGYSLSVIETLNRMHYSARVIGHVETLSATVIEMNLSRISQAIKLAADKAEQELKAALQGADRSAAFEARKASARRKVELQSKLADDTITPAELQELETL